MKLAITTYTTQKVVTPAELMPKLAEWGYDGIELWAGDMPFPGYMSWWRTNETRIADVWPEGDLSDEEVATLSAYKEQAEQLGIEILALAPYLDFTAGPQRWEESLAVGRRYIKYAQFLGSSAFRICGGRVASADLTDAQWEAVITGLRELCSLPGAAGMQFCLECHRGRPEDTIASILREIREVGMPNLKVLLQPTSYLGEADERTIMDALYEHTGHVHAGGKSMLEGGMDWTWFLGEMARRGYQGVVSVEGVTEPALENLARLATFMRNAAA